MDGAGGFRDPHVCTRWHGPGVNTYERSNIYIEKYYFLFVIQGCVILVSLLDLKTILITKHFYGWYEQYYLGVFTAIYLLTEVCTYISFSSKGKEKYV